MEDRNTFRGGEEKSGWEMKDTKKKKGKRPGKSETGRKEKIKD